MSKIIHDKYIEKQNNNNNNNKKIQILMYAFLIISLITLGIAIGTKVQMDKTRRMVIEHAVLVEGGGGSLVIPQGTFTNTEVKLNNEIK